MIFRNWPCFVAVFLCFEIQAACGTCSSKSVMHCLNFATGLVEHDLAPLLVCKQFEACQVISLILFFSGSSHPYTWPCSINIQKGGVSPPRPRIKGASIRSEAVGLKFRIGSENSAGPPENSNQK